MISRPLYTLSLLFGLLAWTSAARAADYLPGEVLVQVQPKTNIRQLLHDHHAQLIAHSAYTDTVRLSVNPKQNLKTIIAKMRKDVRVLSVEPNYVLGAAEFNRQGPSMQWTSTFNGEDGPTAYQGQPSIGQVNYGPAAQRFDGTGVRVAILDTGISLRPTTLAPQVLAGWNFVDNNADTDDRPFGLDFNRNGLPDEAVGHGTMVAGLILRFAPRAQLLPVKVLNSDGWGTLWAACEGIRYALADGAQVLNLSLGFRHNSGLLTRAISDAADSGAIIVTSAGNDNSHVPWFPAGNPRALTVAALNADNTKAAFSNFGAVVDLCAPGVEIVSTFWDGRYAAWSGTSFAAPIVSAEATLLLSTSPAQNPDTVWARMLNTSHSVNAWNPKYRNKLGKHGTGLIDMDAALTGL